MDYAVIMAGGSGKRLWPLSRRNRPKQILRLFDGQTLLRKCYQRLEGIFDAQNILVLTNTDYVHMVQEELPELPGKNIISEPVVRDTAGAIGLAATVLNKSDHNANMAVVAADQLLEPVEIFQQSMTTAMAFVHEHPEALLTFGIEPTFPSTQLGYIKFEHDSLGSGVHKISAFCEKPEEETARAYLENGSYVWNSGIFVWRCSTILENLTRFVPEYKESLEKIHSSWDRPDQDQVLKEWFPRLPKISIDYAVMEKSDHVHGIRLNCQWNDLGSFRALEVIAGKDPNGNVIVSQYSEMLESKNNIVATECQDHLLALIGLDGIIVAHSKDATLVCAKDQAHRLKDLLNYLENSNEEFL